MFRSPATGTVFRAGPPGVRSTRQGGILEPLVVYPAGSELAYAVDGEIEKLFKDVAAMQFRPAHS